MAVWPLISAKENSFRIYFSMDSSDKHDKNKLAFPQAEPVGHLTYQKQEYHRDPYFPHFFLDAPHPQGIRQLQSN